MAIYTVSLNLLENLKPAELPYLACILFCFTNEEQPAKLAVDKKQIILTHYKGYSKFGDIIKVWVDMLSNIPSSIESVNVDLDGIEDPEQMCLALCSHTNGSKNMIVYSLTSINADIDEDNCVNCNGHLVKILDRDEAKRVLNERIVYNISNSQVAGRDIRKSSNIV
jgi:hypothetical protein